MAVMYKMSCIFNVFFLFFFNKTILAHGRYKVCVFFLYLENPVFSFLKERWRQYELHDSHLFWFL